MRRLLQGLTLLAVVWTSLSMSGCANKKDESQEIKNQSTSPASSVQSKTNATGTLVANPNPIKVCDGSGSGTTTLTWTSSGTIDVEVRVGRPNGDLFARTGPDGKWTTAKWVVDGTKFYLQDVSGGKPLSLDNTISTVTVAVTSEGCP